MDRRQFLKTLTAAAAPLVVPSTMLSGGDRAPPSQRVAIGIIGAGAMGSAHARAFSTMPGAHVRAVCDVDAAHRRTAAAIVNAAYRNADCDQTADLTALLARTDIDAVVIALPDHWHMTAAILAARAGKAVYCEKPLAWSIGQGRRVVRAADKGEIVFQCGTQQRSAFRFRRACELVRNGRIGRVHTVQVGLPAGDVWAGDATAGAPQAVPAGLDWQKWLGPAPARPYRRDCCHVNWRYVSDFGGGPVTDWGAHHIDIVHWAMNCDRSGPSRIEPLAAAFPRAGPWDTPLTFHVRCRYGRRFVLNVADTGRYPRGVRFVGDEGWIFVSRDVLRAGDARILRTPGRKGGVRLAISNDHRQNFLDAVAGKTAAIAPPEQAHRSAAVAHVANIALRLGRTLRWNPAAERFINDRPADRLLTRPDRRPWVL